MQPIWGKRKVDAPNAERTTPPARMPPLGDQPKPATERPLLAPAGIALTQTLADVRTLSAQIEERLFGVGVASRPEQVSVREALQGHVEWLRDVLARL